MLTITPIYASLAAFLYLGLSFSVIVRRRSNRISYGDGGKDPMIKAIRTHGNFAEYAPFTLFLMAMAELQGGGWLLINFLGLLLLVGRLCHAYGFGRSPQVVILRQIGMVLTFTSLLVSAVANLILAL